MLVDTGSDVDGCSAAESIHHPDVLSPLAHLHPNQDIRAKKRRISPQAGRALEALGHAIEYLADEFAFEGGLYEGSVAEDPQIEAIQLLMSANRTVWYDCPNAASFRERLHGFWNRIHAHRKEIQGSEVRP